MFLMINKITLLIIGTGIIVGGVVAWSLIRKLKINTNKVQASKDDVTKLVENQLICDDLDIGNLVLWFKNNASKANGNAVFFLAKPSAETKKMFAITGKIDQLDSESNLIQVVVDKQKNFPVAMRLVSYNTLPEQLSNQLKSKNYIIISDN